MNVARQKSLYGHNRTCFILLGTPWITSEWKAQIHVVLYCMPVRALRLLLFFSVRTIAGHIQHNPWSRQCGLCLPEFCMTRRAAPHKDAIQRRHTPEKSTVNAFGPLSNMSECKQTFFTDAFTCITPCIFVETNIRHSLNCLASWPQALCTQSQCPHVKVRWTRVWGARMTKEKMQCYWKCFQSY